jgi:dienelactone hydrolase
MAHEEATPGEKPGKRQALLQVPLAAAIVLAGLAGACHETKPLPKPVAEPAPAASVTLGSGVSVRFPAPTVVQTVKSGARCGAAEIRQFEAQRDGIEYGAFVADMIGEMPGDEHGLLDRVAETISQSGMKVIPLRNLDHRGHLARDLEVQAAQGKAAALFRLVTAGQRLVTLNVGATGVQPPDPEAADRFFDSLQIEMDPGEASPGKGLLEARRGFTTTLIPNSYEAAGPAEVPPRGLLDLVRYDAPVGKLAAYVTPDPGDGKRHPAMLWAHGGFGGIGTSSWAKASPDNDQSARAFREAGIVLMKPSWRGENDNPGKFEMFYGEVDDFLAARDYLASLPYVDPERIYVGGHSTGGTMTLLLAESTDRFRAAFSFGGAPNVARVVADGQGYGNTPFDCGARVEARLRSPVYFASAIRRSTFYFEGGEDGYAPEARAMQKLADQAGAPLEVFVVKGGDHFNILDSLTRLLARKILADTETSSGIRITGAEVERAFAERRR